MARLNGLTKDELAKLGDPDALKEAVNAELAAYCAQIRNDGHADYTDDALHEIINARLAALPEHGPERTAIQRTYEIYLAIIDGGVADVRSDDELLHWIEGSEGDHQMLAENPDIDPAGLHLGLRVL